MPDIVLPFQGGAVTSREPALLTPGELQQAANLYYKPGDTTRIWKLNGRSSFGSTGSAVRVKGLALCLFDTGGTDLLLAESGTVIYKATPGVSGAFSSFVTGRNASATHLNVAHSRDRWYLANGYDALLAVESDGTTRTAGMKAPVESATATPTSKAVTATRRPDAEVNGSPGFTNPERARDTDSRTWAYANPSASATHTITYSWPANAFVAGSLLYIRYAVARGASETDAAFGAGGGSDRLFNVTLKLEYSDNSGGAYTTILNQTTTREIPFSEIQTSIAPANMSAERVRITFTYNTGNVEAVARIHDIRVTDGSEVTAFTTTTGFYYAFSEYDDVRGHESVPVLCLPSTGTGDTLLVTLTTQNRVSIGLPSAYVNTVSTNFRVYRTPDGGAQPSSLGLIGIARSGQTFVDNFVRYGQNDQPETLVRVLTVNGPVINQYYFLDNPPPPSIGHVNSYRGALIGTSRTFPRALYYSEPGYPESWPKIDLLDKFPLPERDEVVATASVGDTLVIALKGAMLATRDLPRVVNGVFNAVDISPIKGQPGCVGPYAVKPFSVAGEARCAWVSLYGIHEFNGSTARLLTEDVDWVTLISTSNPELFSLAWNEKYRRLEFSYENAGSGNPNRLMYLHMSPEHTKPSGAPKITLGHSGRASSIVSGVVSGTYRSYTGHVSDGGVYLEDSGAVDASNANAALTSTLQPSRIRASARRQIMLFQGRLRHDGWGASATHTVTVTSQRDLTGTQQTIAKTLTVPSGSRATDFLIARSGDWIELTITQATSVVAGSYSELILSGEAFGAVGRVA